MRKKEEWPTFTCPTSSFENLIPINRGCQTLLNNFQVHPILFQNIRKHQIPIIRHFHLLRNHRNILVQPIPRNAQTIGPISRLLATTHRVGQTDKILTIGGRPGVDIFDFDRR